MRTFWQGLLLGSLMGMIVGLMAVPRLQEEMPRPIMEKGEQLGTLAQRALRGVQENMGQMWQRKLARE